MADKAGLHLVLLVVLRVRLSVVSFCH
jgi:hypothetical protein